MNRQKAFTFALFLAALTLSTVAHAQTVDRAQVAAEIESLREQIRAKEPLLLVTAREDETKYAEFLAQPDTGLARLLPREKWDGYLSIRGGGAYYSFTRRTHEYGYGTNISLEQGHFSTGFAGLDYGMIVGLGDTPLEHVTAEHPSVQHLTSYAPPLAEGEIRKQQRRASEGFTVGEVKYGDRVAAAVNTTYALRSVQYHSEKGDAGRDVLVAFRVVRKDTDGSMTLLWKILKKYPAPKVQSAVAAKP